MSPSLPASRAARMSAALSIFAKSFECSPISRSQKVIDSTALENRSGPLPTSAMVMLIRSMRRCLIASMSRWVGTSFPSPACSRPSTAPCPSTQIERGWLCGVACSRPREGQAPHRQHPRREEIGGDSWLRRLLMRQQEVRGDHIQNPHALASEACGPNAASTIQPTIAHSTIRWARPRHGSASGAPMTTRPTITTPPETMARRPTVRELSLTPTRPRPMPAPR